VLPETFHLSPLRTFLDEIRERSDRPAIGKKIAPFVI
jgi:hypothetical protein